MRPCRRARRPAQPASRTVSRASGVIIIAGLQQGRMGEADLDNLDNLDWATLDWLTDRILDALARDSRVGAAALPFLLPRYSIYAREELTEPLGSALARELDRQARDGCLDECEGWMAVFSEA